MSNRVINKNLAAQEDLLFGEGFQAQKRAGGNYTVSKIRAIYPVNSLEELNSLDPDKFPKARLYTDDGVEDYVYTNGQYERVTDSSLKLKVFQSPTNNLTKVVTFAGGVGVVYEVRKVSDNSLATIYSDKDGVTETAQNGTANVSNGDAEAVFYVADGDYTVTINAVSADFAVKSSSLNGVSLTDAISEDSVVGTRYIIIDRGNSTWVVNPVGATSDAYINIAMASGRVLSLNHNGISKPLEFGWIGDGITPQADVVEFTFNYGKPIDLNVNGTWLLEREVNLPANAITVNGLGRLPVYPYEFPYYALAEKLPTFLVNHNGSDAFRFSKNSSARGSLLRGFNVIRSQGSACVRAFGFDLGGNVSSGPNYGYDVTFNRMGVFDFDSAFDTYLGTASIEPTIADVTIDDCCINRNNHTIRTLDGTAINMLKFTNNKAGQQTVGGIDVRAHSFTEYGNLFEGTPNPVKVRGAYEGLNVGASYFEANSGTALYQIESLRGPSDIRPCTILATSIPPVVASNSSSIRSVYPVIGDGMYSLSAPNFDGTVNSIPEIDTLTTGISYCDKLNQDMFAAPRKIVNRQYREISQSSDLSREVNSVNGKVMLIESLSTLSGATSFNIALSANPFDYVVISFMLKHTDVETPATYITADINGSSATGSRDYSFAEESLHISNEGFKVYTVVVRPQVSMTSVTLRVYPYGVGAAAGKNFKFGGLTVYNTELVGYVKPFIDFDSLHSVNGSSPLTGSWLNGDYFKNKNPSGAGQGELLFLTGTGWVYG